MNGFKQALHELFAHVGSWFKKEGEVVKTDLSSFWAEVGPKVEKLALDAGETVLTAASGVVLAQVTGGASIGLSLEAGLKVIEAAAPAALEQAGKQAAIIALSKALPAGTAPAGTPAANAQAANTVGALNT